MKHVIQISNKQTTERARQTDRQTKTNWQQQQQQQLLHVSPWLIRIRFQQPKQQRQQSSSSWFPKPPLLTKGKRNKPKRANKTKTKVKVKQQQQRKATKNAAIIKALRLAESAASIAASASCCCCCWRKRQEITTELTEQQQRSTATKTNGRTERATKRVSEQAAGWFEIIHWVLKIKATTTWRRWGALYMLHWLHTHARTQTRFIFIYHVHAHIHNAAIGI